MNLTHSYTGLFQMYLQFLVFSMNSSFLDIKRERDREADNLAKHCLVDAEAFMAGT